MASREEELKLFQSKVYRCLPRYLDCHILLLFSDVNFHISKSGNAQVEIGVSGGPFWTKFEGERYHAIAIIVAKRYVRFGIFTGSLKIFMLFYNHPT